MPICGVVALGHSLAAYLEYASLRPSRAAWHLDLFEQPGEKRVYPYPANSAAGFWMRGWGIVSTATKRPH